MKVLLLAAGYGTRLRPLTESVPKCLVPIQGKPLLSYWLNMLNERTDIEEIFINTHYLSDQVVAFVSHFESDHKITLVYEEELLHTAGTVRKIASYIGDTDLMLVHADNLSKFDMDAFVYHHAAHPECDLTMMTFTTDVPKSCGVVELNASGVVLNMHEKVENPPSNLANGAVYLLRPQVVDFIANKPAPYADFSNDIIPEFYGKIQTFHNDVFHMDIGTIEQLNKANELWQW